jgi:hypothetical protein
LDDFSRWTLVDDDPATGQSVAAGPHVAAHLDGGADELDVTGLSGLLADPQTPLTENVQDVVGAMLTDSSTIDFTYDDGANTETAEVKDDSLTNAKLANMAANTFKSNLTGSSADPADNTIADVQAALANARVNAQTGTTYTILASDNGKIVTCSNASPITVTVPSGLGAGFNCLVIQKAGGQITFSPSSTTINNRQTHTKSAGQHALCTLAADVADNFYLGGDTSA